MTVCNSDVVEPIVPFSLGVLITNNGYGEATNLQISSAQPEIIDNEKGLLIKFAITGTQLGNDSFSPSLTVNFGDILPKTTKMARWIMTSTLSGVFSNYSATFQNTNPLGEILNKKLLSFPCLIGLTLCSIMQFMQTEKKQNSST